MFKLRKRPYYKLILSLRKHFTNLSCQHISFIFSSNPPPKETIHLDNTYISHRYTTDLQIDNIFIKQLTIYTLEDDFRSYQDYGIALGYHYKSKSFSLIDNLYESNQIDKKQFSFYNINEANPLSEMHIYFGGVPNNKTYKYKGVIKVDESLPTWGSMFNFIIYNSKEYKFNLPCMISSSALTIVSSDEIYNFLLSYLRRKLVGRNAKKVFFFLQIEKCFYVIIYRMKK